MGNWISNIKPKLGSSCCNSSGNFNNDFQRFSDATSMHGFHELFYAKSLFWKIVWLIILISAISVTIFQCHSAVYQYIFQSSSTEIQPAKKSDILYPPVKLCIPSWISWINWTVAYERNFTKEEIMWGVSYLQRVYSSTYFDQNSVGESFIQHLAKNKINNINGFYDLVAKTSSAYLEGMTTNHTVISMNSLCYIMSHDVITSALDKKKNDDKSPLSYSNSRMNSLQLLITNWKYNPNPYYDDPMSHPDSGWDYNSPTMDPNSYQIDNDEYNHYINELVGKMGYQIDESNSKDFTKNFTEIKVPILFFANGYNDNDGLYLEKGVDVTFSIKPSAHKWKSTRENPCTTAYRTFSGDQSCSMQCIAKARYYLWGCLNVDLVPFFDNPNVSLCKDDMVNFLQNVPLNSSITYVTSYDQEVGNFTVFEDMMKKCSNSCQVGCETWSYDVSMSLKSVPSDVKNLATPTFSTTVNLEYPVDGGILVMTETDSQSWENFIGNVGGLLGIWTGASILSLIQIFYLCFCEGTVGPSLPLPSWHRPQTNVKSTLRARRINTIILPK